MTIPPSVKAVNYATTVIKFSALIVKPMLDVRPLLRLAAALLLVALAGAATAAQTTDKVEAEAREVLQQYATALASLDAAAVKKLQPAIDVETLKKAFKEMKALEVAIDNVKVLSVDASLARVSCRVSQTLTPKAGSKQTTAVTRVVRLRRAQPAWVIDAFER